MPACPEQRSNLGDAPTVSSLGSPPSRILGQDNHGTERGCGWIGAEAVRARASVDGRPGPAARRAPAPSHCRATAGAPEPGVPRRTRRGPDRSRSRSRHRRARCALVARARPPGTTCRPPIRHTGPRRTRRSRRRQPGARRHPATALRRPLQGRPESRRGRRRSRRSHARPAPGLPSAPGSVRPSARGTGSRPATPRRPAHV